MALHILIIGALIVAAIAVRGAFRRVGLPPLVGFILIGFGLRALDARVPYLGNGLHELIEHLGLLGLFALLFRVGLESNLRLLLHEVPRALLIWLGNVGLSGALGFFAARSLLGFDLVPSLFAAAALTATSVGVAAQVWRDAGAFNSRNGRLLLDVAELDDLSAIALMLVLVSVAPVLAAGADGAIGPLVLASGGIVLAKAAAFGAACFVFSRYLEAPVTRWLAGRAQPPDPMLIVAGLGVVIAAAAALMGLSLAIGALFAGLIFSRDPQAVRVDAAFGALYDLFVPFFFIGIGLAIAAESVPLALGAGAALLGAALLGKLAGAGLPAYLTNGAAGALLIGVSMVPRAEIAIVIAREGNRLGPWAVPDDLLAAIVGVAFVSCIVAPVALRFMLARWPQREDERP